MDFKNSIYTKDSVIVIFLKTFPKEALSIAFEVRKVSGKDFHPVPLLLIIIEDPVCIDSHTGSYPVFIEYSL